MTVQQPPANVPACCVSSRGEPTRGRYEADISAESEQAETRARLSETDEHGRRADGAAAAPGQGAPTPDGLRRGSRERYGFPRTARLLKASDFARVLKAGRRLRAGPLTVHVARAGAHAARLGLVVGRRAGPAVARNRIKRSLREEFRQQRSLFPPGTDLVIVVTRDLTSVSAAALRQGIVAALRAAARQPVEGTRHGTGEPPAR